MNAWADPDPPIYRYTVKCDRERSQAIEKAARAAGLSATSFVQRHFESILDDCRQAEAETAREEWRIQSGADERAIASMNGMTPGQLAVWRAVKSADDGHGRGEIGVGAIAKLTGLTAGSVRVILSRLVAAGHLTRISGGGWRRTTVYRIHPIMELLR